MRNWKVVLAGLPLWLGAAFSAHGLGLGDIEVRSALNQPLDAEIELLAVKPDELSQIKINLADQIAFTTSGIDRVPLLSQLTFVVEERGPGKAVIRVTTQRPVKEPFLDFIIEANWSTGRLLREYTLLLDPPVFAGAKAAPAQQAATTERKTKSVSELIAGQDDSSAPKRKTKSVSELLAGEADVAAPRRTKNVSDLIGSGGSAGEYGPTGRSDTLWAIAEQVKSDDANSVEQVMMALYRSNPEAFYDDNINNLRAGFVLRKPDQAKIDELTKSEAARQAREHYSKWLAARRTASATAIDKVGSDQGLAAFADEGGAAAGAGGARSPALRLESPEEGAGGLSAGAGDEEITAALAMREAENKELKDRVASLQEQLSTMERLITLKDDALVEMQRKLGDTGQPVEIPAEAQPEQAPPVEVAQDTAEVQPEVVAEDTVTPAAQPEAEEAQHEEGSWTDLLMDTTVLGIIVGVVLLIGAVVWMVMRRRSEDNYFEADYPAMDAGLSIPSGDKLNFTPSAESSAAAGLAAGAAVGAAAGAGARDDLADMGLETMEADEADIDPIAEADVYLAYRRFQQAEEIVKDALRQHPDRQDLQLKMLEIYYSANNKQAFEAQAEALYALLGGEDNDIWAKASEMGRELCPDHPLFNPDAKQGGNGGFGNELTGFDQGETESAGFEQNNMFGDETDNLFGDQAYAEPAHDQQSHDFDSSAMDSMFGEAQGGLDDVGEPQQESGVIDFEAGLGQGNGEAAHGGADFAMPEQAEEHSEEKAHGLDFNFDAGNEFDFSKEPSFDEPAQEASEQVDQSEQDFLKSFGKGGLDNFNFEPMADDRDAGRAPASRQKSQGSEIEEIFTGLEEAEFGEDTDDLFSGTDMIGTKLDLARAYIDMDDREGARGILQEVMEEGDDAQKRQAKELMAQIG